MINCDKCITVFSFNGKSYDKYYFEGVSIYGGDGIALTDSGFKQKAEFRIRIRLEDDINIK